MQATLSDLLSDVRNYGATNLHLRKAHHFLFCKTLIRSSTSKNIIVMGINPGETTLDWKSTNFLPSEESFELDFHVSKRSSSSRKSMSNIDFFLPNHNIYLTELFFWSSNNISELVSRYGKINPENPHIQFCKEINLKLIDLIKPDAVIFTGVSYFKLVASIYDLEYVKELLVEENKKLAVLAASKHCPWIFTRHWSGSFGFSNSDKDKIKKFISKIT